MLKPVSVTLLSILLVACGGGGGGGGTTPPPPPVNQAPVAADQSVATDPGVASSGSLSATDANGDTLTYAVVANPASGTVALSGTGNRDFEYTPNGGFVGTDTFTFNANDGTAGSNTATVTVFVNFAPVVTGVSVNTSDIADVAGSVSANDAEGDAFTFAIASPPSKGTVSNFDAATGDFVYTPDPTQDGADTFEVTATDMFRTSQPAIVSVEIFDWSGSRLSGGVDGDIATTNGLLLLDDGGLIFGGATGGSFAGGVSGGMLDAWLRRVDRRGAEVWTTQYGDAGDNTVRAILARPQNDGFYVASSQENTSVIRFDFDGNILWSAPVDFGGRDVVGEGYWSGIDDNGDIYMLSWTRDLAIPGNPLDGLVTKISGADGSIIWHRDLLTSTTDPASPFVNTATLQPRGIDFDSTGRVVVSGDFRDNGGLRACFSCPFIAMLDPATGADVWVREPQTFETCGFQPSGRFYRTKVDTDDTIIVNGTTTESSSQGVLARFNADGTQEIWSVCDDSGVLQTSSFTNPVVLADGSILNFTSLLTYDPMTSDLLSSSVRLSKYSNGGAEQWASTLTPLRADGTDAITYAGSMAEDGQGPIYVTAWTDGEVNGDTNAGSEDAFIERFDADGVPSP